MGSLLASALMSNVMVLWSLISHNTNMSPLKSCVIINSFCLNYNATYRDVCHLFGFVKYDHQRNLLLVTSKTTLTNEWNYVSPKISHTPKLGLCFTNASSRDLNCICARIRKHLVSEPKHSHRGNYSVVLNSHKESLQNISYQISSLYLHG